MAQCALAITRLVLVSRFDLAPDEAYYLTWARGSPGVDHPPLVAWLARGALALHMHSIERSVRVVPVVCALVTAWCLDRLCAGLHASLRARWVLAALTLLPLPAAGGLLLTPDPPLVACASAVWLLGLAPGPRSYLRAAGIIALAAVAVLAKVNALVVLPALALARWTLGTAAPVLPRWTLPLATFAQGCALGLGIPSLRFQWAHAFTVAGPLAGLASRPEFPLAGVLVLAAGQVGLLLPALGLFPRRWPGRVFRALGVLTLVPCVPVFASALVRVPEPNWTALGYPSLLTAMALASDVLPVRTVTRWTVGTLAIALVLHVHLVVPWLPFPWPSDPTARLHGWRRWACGHGAIPARDLPPYALPAERAVYTPTCP